MKQCLLTLYITNRQGTRSCSSINNFARKESFSPDSFQLVSYANARAERFQVTSPRSRVPADDRDASRPQAIPKLIVGEGSGKVDGPSVKHVVSGEEPQWSDRL